MLDLNKIFGMREQMLPQEGFWGFVLGNWLTIAIVIMVLGFVIDQVLYIVRYRPQDDIMRFMRRFGLNIREDASEGADEPEEPDHPEDLPMQNPANVEIKDSDRPVIRRGGIGIELPVRPRSGLDSPGCVVVANIIRTLGNDSHLHAAAHFQRKNTDQ